MSKQIRVDDELYRHIRDQQLPGEPIHKTVRRLLTAAMNAREASLGERLRFQPIDSRTHGYNGQEHR